MSLGRGGEGKAVSARLVLTNTGAGHYYPTYATPLVVLRAFLATGDGRPVPGTMKTAYIGRMVSLDLSKEYYDTRIPPGGRFVLEYALGDLPPAAARLVFEARVLPDAFYTRFYEAFLGKVKNRGKRALIEEALRRSRAGAYLLFRREMRLGAGPPAHDQGP